MANDINNNILQASEIIAQNLINQLKFDKTITAEIVESINMSTGEYRVKYQGNTFLAYVDDLKVTYKPGDNVYIKIPEGDMSNKKIITGKARRGETSTSTGFDYQIEPKTDNLLNEYIINEKSVGLIAGSNINKIDYLQEQNIVSKNITLFAQNYDTLQIKADFQSPLESIHSKGNYGIKVNFITKGEEDLSCILDINSFAGNPYNYFNWSTQTINFKIQKDYILGLRSIEFFQDGFELDKKLLYNNITSENEIVENNSIPNLFVKNVDIRFIEVINYNELGYYINITAPKGTQLFSTGNIELHANLKYYGKNIINDNSCQIKWFVRNPLIKIGDELYNNLAGPGWEQLNETNTILTVTDNDVLYSKEYKLVIVYKNEIVLDDTIIIYDSNESNIFIQQNTNVTNIELEIIGAKKEDYNQVKWFVETIDGEYEEIENSNSINLIINKEKYLNNPVVTFYCALYKGLLLQTVRSIQIQNTTSTEDLTVTFYGEDYFEYNENGDFNRDYAELERQIAPKVDWKQGYGSNYIITWKLGDIQLTEEVNKEPEDSMLKNVWIEQENQTVHFQIRTAFNAKRSNNILTMIIQTIDGRKYEFEKKIEFVKLGEQTATANTYHVVIRPCDKEGNLLEQAYLSYIEATGKWEGFYIKALVYQGDTEITENITYKWSYESTIFNLESQSNNIQFIKVNITGDSITTSKDDKIFQNIIKVQATIKESEERNINVYYNYPVISLLRTGNFVSDEQIIINIPTIILYSNNGYYPNFTQKEISAFCGNKELNLSKYLENSVTSLHIDKINEKYILFPPTSFDYNKGTEVILANLTQGESKINIYIPIMMQLDITGNEAIEGWDGTALDTNTSYIGSIDNQPEETNEIYAPQVGAGYKTEDGFTGVLMGKIGTNKTGLFGYSKGQSTFGLQENGIAYFGTAGAGQIVVDGTSATLKGSGGGNNTYGMTITLSANSKDDEAIKLGGGKFLVNYDGSMKATSGTIGAWKITDKELYSNGEIKYNNNNIDYNNTTATTILSPSEGIGTNKITIFTEVGKIGDIGCLEGGTSTSTTTNLGINSNGGIIFNAIGTNLRMSGKEQAWLSIAPDRNQPISSTTYSLSLRNSYNGNSGHYLIVEGIDAENQHGIYARFA